MAIITQRRINSLYSIAMHIAIHRKSITMLEEQRMLLLHAPDIQSIQPFLLIILFLLYYYCSSFSSFSTFFPGSFSFSLIRPRVSIFFHSSFGPKFQTILEASAAQELSLICKREREREKENESVARGMYGIQRVAVKRKTKTPKYRRAGRAIFTLNDIRQSSTRRELLATKDLTARGGLVLVATLKRKPQKSREKKLQENKERRKNKNGSGSE